MKPNYKKIWWESMRKKHPGLTDDEIRNMFKVLGGKHGGVNSPLKNNPELAKQLGKRGSESRWAKESTK